MKERGAESKELAELRKRAEARLERTVTSIPGQYFATAPELRHDLRTHQIELEMQNEELRRAQDALVESRDRYSDLYDFAPVGYATVSRKGLILEANLTLARMLGIERRALVKHPLPSFICPQSQDVFYRHCRGILESKQRQTCQLRMLRSDAEPRWVEMDSILIDLDDGGDAQLRSAIIDIGERKRAEAEKQRLEQQILRAKKLESLGLLAGGIAHDFNTILAAILGNAELALEKLPPRSPGRRNVRRIEKASKRAVELIKQILAWSGKGRFVFEPIDAGELVEEMAHLLEVSISQNAVLEYKFGENLPVFNGDVTKISQVIMNLIINASEAIGDDSGMIVLSTGVVDCDRAYFNDLNGVLRTGMEGPLPEGVYTYFEVADTGCGMDAVAIEKIFDPFFTTKFPGRGLGMAAVLGILGSHKGALKIRSEVGKGTTIRILFPASE